MHTDSSDDQIPTLTDIIHPGDESMKNHFDGSYFDLQEEDEKAAAEMAEQYGSDEEDLKTTVACLIQDTLNETLPEIEERLKAELLDTVMKKLESRQSD